MKFKYTVSLTEFPVEESLEYSEYIHSLYVEDIDYQLNGGYWERTKYSVSILRNYPVELHKLMTSSIIRFKEENDLLAFKLKFNI
jgi:hypothetical protein